VVPNSLDIILGGLDWLCIPSMFADCISSTPSALREDIRKYLATHPKSNWRIFSPDLGMDHDISLRNLEGADALEDAKRWVESGKTRSRLAKIVSYLEGPEKEFVASLLNHTDPISSLGVTSRAILVSHTRGKATLSQAEGAMADLQTGVSQISRPFYQSQESNSDTEDGDAEVARGVTADFIFGHIAASQIFNETTFSPPFMPICSLPSLNLSPQAVFTNDATPPCASITSSQIPRTPNMCRTSPQIPSLMAPEFLPSASNPVVSVVHNKNNEFLPRTPRKTTLRSPLQLFSSTPVARKSAISSYRMSHEDLYHYSKRTVGDVPDAPLLHLQNAKSRKGSLFTTNAKDNKTFGGAPSKRRRFDSDCGSAFGRCEPTSIAVIERAAPSVVSATPARTADEGLNTTGSSCTSLSTDSGVNFRSGRSCASKLERRRLAQKLSTARPDLVGVNHIAKFDQKPQFTTVIVQQGKDLSLPSRAEQKQKFKFTEELPKNDAQVVSDIEMDHNRSRWLAESFQNEYAKGLRPGLVVPRLSCLESQEEEG
jgi:hypothetical protein